MPSTDNSADDGPLGGGGVRAQASPLAKRPEQRQDSKVPVASPRFASQDLDGQVGELLAQISPTPVSGRVARRLAECAARSIGHVFQGVEVTGFASCDIVRGTAFGVAVPELDLVATASPHCLAQALQARLAKGGLSMAKLDARKLQKSAIRVCTDQLVSVGGFKFRRSAFRGLEPKVTLMAPPHLGGVDQSIPVDFSVNCTTPLFNQALVFECASLEARAESLILVVRRWAKDRGISHAAKGHLPPYAWTLLAVFFLQVGCPESAMLPPLRGHRLVDRMVIKKGSGVVVGCSDGCHSSPHGPTYRGHDARPCGLSVGGLFGCFVRFYGSDLDLRAEEVSVRWGRRRPRSASPLDCRPRGNGAPTPYDSETGGDLVTIEDPFDPARNLGAGLTVLGLARLREECCRATALMDEAAPLGELLEPWVPPDVAAGPDQADGSPGRSPAAGCARESKLGAWD